MGKVKLTIYRVALRDKHGRLLLAHKYYLDESLAVRRARRVSLLVFKRTSDYAAVTVDAVGVTTSGQAPVIGVMYSSPNVVEFYGAHYHPTEAAQMQGVTSRAVGEEVRVVRLKMYW